MKCLYCGSEDSKVIDSRVSEELNAIKRRRECLECGRRFNTFETIEVTPIMVVKSNGNRERFSSSKVKNGIVKACEKRPVSMADIDKLVSEIEKKVYNSMEEEISSKVIGEYVMEGLKDLDEVSYIRFASIYKKFKDVSMFFNFVNEFESMLKDTEANKDKKEVQENNETKK
ncbi:MAG: transcriptional repressor NrdR [Clostridia bacterium]|nr:transcriptional repressor NrdR [Clostridia bacterium]